MSASLARLRLLLRRRHWLRYNGAVKRRSALVVIGAALTLPTMSLELRAGLATRNDPREWGRWWISDKITCINPFYPRDGRETIYRPYERFAGTDTVGAFLGVYDSLCCGQQTGFPEDFSSYLQQRVASIDYLLTYADAADRVDPFGMIVPGMSGEFYADL